MSTASPTGTRQTNVIQGGFAVGNRDEDVLVTILGSCVATCLYDPATRIGGLNHFLLPEGRGADQSNQKYGTNLMELLINALLKKGARRESLEAKLFGGGRMISGMANIGARNAAFAEQFLRNEAIPLTGKSLGGDQARKLRFWPASGRAQQMLLARTDPPPVEIIPSPAVPARTDPAGELDLF